MSQELLKELVQYVTWGNKELPVGGVLQVMSRSRSAPAILRFKEKR